MNSYIKRELKNLMSLKKKGGGLPYRLMNMVMVFQFCGKSTMVASPLIKLLFLFRNSLGAMLLGVQV